MENSAGPKHLIIHGHFYQPPRENPWTETIERQDGAAPFHDWNDRIANECYLPNALSRRLDDFGRITKLVNNYEWISFNFGPTLISWLEDNAPEVYARILEADRASAKRLNGHGNAIAQCYNHAIMPLASRRDRETQIRWGARDFERRFGRPSEGIWLPETAVNAAVLESLIEFGFKFIVLSPHQALRVRALDDGAHWKDVSRGNIQTGMPYRCFDPGAKGKRDARRFIDVFFYDAPLSTDVSFNHLLRNGDGFADAIALAYPRVGGDLVAVATDGEVYGHHEPFADMALAYLVEAAAPRRGLAMTNFGAYLAAHEPRYEVDLKPGPNSEGTAWSCSHGVGRWKEDCGDSAGGREGWNQKWRAPLRAGLNTLGETLAALYEKEGAELFADPWKARNDYIDVVEARDRDAARAFVESRARRALSPEEISRALALLECQRNAQLMFTSCGWFFSDISGIETVQILRYAARAIELAGPAQWLTLEKQLLGDLKGAVSNIPAKGTGANIYNGPVKESILTRPALAALYAITAHLSEDESVAAVYGYPVKPLDRIAGRMGPDRVGIGALEMVSPFTCVTAVYEYLVYVEDEASFVCFVRERRSEQEFREMTERLARIAREGSARELLSGAADYFGPRRFALQDFLPEDRDKILRRFMGKRLDLIEGRFSEIYHESKHLLILLKDANIHAPESILVPARTFLTNKLVAEVERWERSLDPAGLEGIKAIVTEASVFGVPIDTSSAAASFSALLLDRIGALADNLDPEASSALEQFVNLADEMGIRTNYRDIQNRIYFILESKISPLLDGFTGRTDVPEQEKHSISAFLRLARRFNFNTDAWTARLDRL
jgi:alpha-amylase/alpha-mannosidase (GH57 family)